MSTDGKFLANLEVYYNVLLEKDMELLKTQLVTIYPLEKWNQLLNLGPATSEKMWERVLVRIFLGKTLGLEIPKDAQKVQLSNLYQLINLPEIQCSLSHHKKFMACCYTSKPATFLGIDIEPRERVILSESYRLFAHKKDDSDEQNELLKLWVKKEAAFKAIHHYQSKNNFEKKITSLAEVAITKNDFFFENIADSKPGILVDLSHDTFICFLAILS
jgi:phosphopantetheinyl transferase (holo-ACP synthase)